MTLGDDVIARSSSLQCNYSDYIYTTRVFHWQFLISDIFFVFLKFRACYITGQWNEFRVKNAFLCFHILFWHCFVVFHHKICVFLIFIAFFGKLPNFRKRILTNQKQELVIRNCQRNCMLQSNFSPEASTHSHSY